MKNLRHGVWPDVDMRFKDKPQDMHDASRLLFNTSLLACSNELFSRGISRAIEADGFYKQLEEERLRQYRELHGEDEPPEPKLGGKLERKGGLVLHEEDNKRAEMSAATCI